MRAEQESYREVVVQIAQAFPPEHPHARSRLYSTMLEDMQKHGLVELANTVSGASQYVPGGDMPDLAAAVAAYSVIVALTRPEVRKS
jgi:hypothetical protein